METIEKSIQTSNSTSLYEHVHEAMANYFSHLDGSDPVDLYNLFQGEVEPALFEAVMTYTKGNQTKAAVFLGLARGTLRKKLRQYFGDRYVGTIEDKR